MCNAHFKLLDDFILDNVLFHINYNDFEIYVFLILELYKLFLVNVT